MDRLTDKDAADGYRKMQNIDYKLTQSDKEYLKLAAYEDSNLEPAEVEALKAENKRLKEVIKIHKEADEIVSAVLKTAVERINKATAEIAAEGTELLEEKK